MYKIFFQYDLSKLFVFSLSRNFRCVITLLCENLFFVFKKDIPLCFFMIEIVLPKNY